MQNVLEKINYEELKDSVKRNKLNNNRAVYIVKKYLFRAKTESDIHKKPAQYC